MKTGFELCGNTYISASQSIQIKHPASGIQVGTSFFYFYFKSYVDTTHNKHNQQFHFGGMKKASFPSLPPSLPKEPFLRQEHRGLR